MTADPRAHQLVQVQRKPAQQSLGLRWADGHEADYPATYLRGYCPCAACQGHTNDAIRYLPPRSPVEVVAVEPVGNYAISLRFSDGHGTGIYRFEFLRRVCPCGSCAAGLDPDHSARPAVERS